MYTNHWTRIFCYETSNNLVDNKTYVTAITVGNKNCNANTREYKNIDVRCSWHKWTTTKEINIEKDFCTPSWQISWIYTIFEFDIYNFSWTQKHFSANDDTIMWNTWSFPLVYYLLLLYSLHTATIMETVAMTGINCYPYITLCFQYQIFTVRILNGFDYVKLSHNLWPSELLQIASLALEFVEVVVNY